MNSPHRPAGLRLLSGPPGGLNKVLLSLRTAASTTSGLRVTRGGGGGEQAGRGDLETSHDETFRVPASD